MIADTEKAIRWGVDTLNALGYKITKLKPEIIRETPWSSVFRFNTSEGFVYLKQVPKLISLEPSVTELLFSKFNAPVPEVIAKNAKSNCFIMRDVGNPLREFLQQSFEVKILSKAIRDFTQVQISATDHVDEFLALGVPNWRLDKLPSLYDGLLSREGVLRSDGLLAHEIDNLKALRSEVVRLCEKLSLYGIKQTIVQSDFHDNNVMINPVTQVLTFIDLGEIVISHPFFSMVGCLHQTKRHHDINVDSEVYLKLEGACLEKYLNFESRDNLSEAFEVASVLWIVYEALVQYRLRVVCGKENEASFQQGKLALTLRQLIKIQ